MDNFENSNGFLNGGEENNAGYQENSPQVTEVNDYDSNVNYLNENINNNAYQQPEPFAEKPQPTQGNNNYNFEKVLITPVTEITDYKPMAKGLKVFSVIMAVVIALTASCVAGYFFGKKSVPNSYLKKIPLSLSAKPADTDEMTAAQVYDMVNKSVVGITIYNKAGESAQASGVIYTKDGYVVTNDHIYAEIPAAKFIIYDYNGNEYNAEYVAGDSVSDLSLLKITNGKDFTVPDFGNSDEIVYGESVVAIGRPSDAKADSSITKGIISHTKRRMQTTSNYTTRLIQTDSAINPGSSGGALVNMYGQIIGITSSKLAGVNYDSMGFAIPTTTMKRVVSELAEKGKVETRAKLGISYQEITSVLVEIGKYKSTGLLVATVSEDSDLAGKVNKGDIITYVNGIKITGSDIVLDIIDESAAGDEITVTVLDSNGNSNDYKAVLKANVGESSYSLSDKGFSTNEVPSTEIPDGKSDGGTFDFPQGE